MDTQTIKRSLRRELGNPRKQELFELARRRNAAFADHSNPFSILTVLNDCSTTDYSEKEALTRALIAEQQRTPNSLWTAILIIGYLPLLEHLRSRITGNPLKPEDLDQVVISTFLQVVEEFPLERWHNYTSVRLRQQTQRRLFRELNKERSIKNLRDSRPLDEIPVSEFVDCSIWKLRRSGKCDSQDIEAMAGKLIDYIGNAIEPAKLDLVIATIIRGESLRGFMARHDLTSLGSGSDREYQRLKKQRSRTLIKVRQILRKKCPRSNGTGLCNKEN